MKEVLEAIYDYFKNDDAKDDKGNWLDDYDHRTYLELLNTDMDNLHKHLIPTRQPEVIQANLPIVAFYIIDMPLHRLSPFFKDITVEFDIYTNDTTLEQNLDIAKRHFQLLEKKVLSTNLAYLGKWYHQTEMSLLLSNPNLYCYAQRFVAVVKREYLITKRKK
jgi:hypothetical protein